MPIIYSILVFILSFVLLLGSYIALVATNKIKKRILKNKQTNNKQQLQTNHCHERNHKNIIQSKKNHD